MSKVLTPIKNKLKTKSYQVRLTITPELNADIVKARKKYKYLDDIEILKIFIGRGTTQVLGNEDNEFNLESNYNFVSNNDDKDVDYSTMYSKTTGKKIKWD